MNESAQGIIVMLSFSVVSAAVCHSVFHSILKGSLISAVAASIAFQAAAYLHLGHFDPFFLIALVVCAAVAFVTALVVGLPFFLCRRRRDVKNKIKA